MAWTGVSTIAELATEALQAAVAWALLSFLATPDKLA